MWKLRTSEQLRSFSPTLWPTDEEIQEICASSIESDCRALLAGTLHARSWFDIAGTWYQRDDTRVLHYKVTKKKEN